MGKITVRFTDRAGQPVTVEIDMDDVSTEVKSESGTEVENIKEASLIDCLRETGFTVHEYVDDLESHKIGELNLEKIQPNDPCKKCHQPVFILMEVVADDDDEEIDVDHDLIGEVCVACGWFDLNPDSVGSGVFGLLDEDAHGDVFEFIEQLLQYNPEEWAHSQYIQTLVKQERDLMRRVFKTRQKLYGLRKSKNKEDIPTAEIKNIDQQEEEDEDPE